MTDRSRQETHGRRRPPRLWKSLLKWAFRVSASLVIILLFSLLLCPVVTDTRLVKGALARAVSRKLNGAHVRLESLRLAPLEPHVLHLGGLVIAEPGRPDLPILEVGRLDCRWRPADLLEKRVHISLLDADSVRVVLRRTDGRWNFRTIFAPSTEPFRLEDVRLPIRLDVDVCKGSNMRFEFDMDGLVGAVLQGVSLESSCSLAGLLDGVASFGAAAETVVVRVPQGRLIFEEGLEVRGRMEKAGPSVRVSGAFAADRLAASLDEAGALAPLALAGGLKAELDLARGGEHRFEVCLQIPGLLTDVLSVSLESAPDWYVEGENILAVDLAGLAGPISSLSPDIVRSVGLTGQALVRTEVEGALRTGSPLEAYVRLTNRVFGWDVDARTEFDLPLALGPGPGAAAPFNAEASGVSWALTQRVEFALADGIGGMALTDFTCRVDSARAGLPGLFEFTGRGLRAGVLADVSVPTASSLSLRGGLSAEELALRSPMAGEIASPVDLDFKVFVTDLLDPARSLLVVERVRGSLGRMVPRFWLAASAAGFGQGGIDVAGGGVVDLGETASILDGLTEEVRSVLGEVEVAGVAAATFSVCGRPGLGGICLSADGSVALADLAFRRGMLEAGVGELDLLYSVFVPVDAGLLPHDIRGVVHASGADIAAALLGEGTADSPAFAVSVGALEGELSGRLSGMDLSEVEADVVLSVRDVEAQVPFGSGAPPVNVPAVSCDLAGRVRSNPLAGDLRLADLYLEMPGVARLEVPSLALAGFGGDALEGTVEFRLDDLGELMRLAADVLPVEMAEALPELEGVLSIEAEVAGRMPLARRIVAALETGGPLPGVEFLPLGAFYERDAPLDVTLKCRVERVEARHHIREGLTVDVTVNDSQFDLDLQDGQVSGGVVVNVPVVSFGRFPGEPYDMSLAARFGMQDFDDLTISDVVFDSMGALTVRGGMRATGLSGLVASRLPQSLLEGTDVALQLSGALRPGSLELPEGLVVGGEAHWDLDLVLDGGRGLSLALRPRLDGVSVAYGDLFSVQGLDGRCTFSKRWDVVGPQQLAAERASLSQTMIATVPASSGPDLRAVIPEFATAVDGLAPAADRLGVETISFMGHELVSDLETELAVRGATFAVPRFHLGLLGGRVVGAASFHPAPGGRELSLRGEFAGVDFRRMLPPGLRAFRGDAEVTGNFLLDVLVSGSPATGAASNPIKDVAGRLDVTHIGSAALDRLLLALDPEAADPRIVRTRKALALGTPRRATASLSRGFASVDVELDLPGGLSTSYSIPRFNVAQLFGTSLVADAFAKFGPVMDALDVLDAERLEITAEGSIRFR